jgi:hypothetical protein
MKRASKNERRAAPIKIKIFITIDSHANEKIVAAVVDKMMFKNMYQFPSPRRRAFMLSNEIAISPMSTKKGCVSSIFTSSAKNDPQNL